MHRGYVKLYRCMQDHYLWNETPYDKARAWIDLIMLANHKTGTLRKRGIKITVNRGQVGWSERELGDRWGWSRGKVKRFINELEDEHQIEQQNGPQNINVTSLITILNYEKYQTDEPQNEPETGRKTNHKRAANSTMNKNEKNEKNEKKKDIPGDDESSPADTSNLGDNTHGQQHKWLCSWFQWAIQELTGSKYIFSKADGVILSRLLKQSGGIGDVMKRGSYYLVMPVERRFPHGARTIKGFSTMFNDLAGMDGFDLCRSEGLLPPADKKLSEFIPWKENNLNASSAVAK